MLVVRANALFQKHGPRFPLFCWLLARCHLSACVREFFRCAVLVWRGSR